jgi:hypothetical protein
MARQERQELRRGGVANNALLQSLRVGRSAAAGQRPDAEHLARVTMAVVSSVRGELVEADAPSLAQKDLVPVAWVRR